MDRDQKEVLKERLSEWLTECNSKEDFLESCREVFLLDEEDIEEIIWIPLVNRVVRVNIDNHLISIYPDEEKLAKRLARVAR